jgi:hypothetical protein
MEGNNDLVFQARLDMQGVYGEVEKGVTKGPEIPIELDPTQAIKAIEKVAQSISAIGSAITKNAEAFEQLEEKAKAAAKSIADMRPDAEKLAEALVLGKDDAKEFFDGLDSELQKFTVKAQSALGKDFVSDLLKSPSKLAAVRPVVDKMAEAKEKEFFGKDTRSLMKESDSLTEKDRKQIVSTLKLLEEEAKEAREEADRLGKEFVESFGEAKAEGEALLAILKQVEAAVDFDAEGSSSPQIDMLTGFARELQKIAKGTNPFETIVAQFREDLAEVWNLFSSQEGSATRAQVEAARAASGAIRGNGSNGVPFDPQPLPPVGVVADPTALLASIREALAKIEEQFTLDIRADREKLVESVRSVLKSLEDDRFEVHVTADAKKLIDSVREALRQVEANIFTVPVQVDGTALRRSLDDTLASIPEDRLKAKIGVNKTFLAAQIREMLKQDEDTQLNLNVGVSKESLRRSLNDAIRIGSEEADDLRLFIDEKHLAAEIKTALAAIAASEYQLPVKVDPAVLLGSIREELAQPNNALTVDIKANKDVLIESIRNILKQAEGLKVNVKANITERERKRREAEEAGTGPKPALSEEERLAARARSRQLKEAAARDPLSVISQLGNQPLMDAFARAKQAEGSGDAAKMKAAISSRDFIVDELNKVGVGEFSTTVKKQVEAILKVINRDIFGPLNVEFNRLSEEMANASKKSQSSARKISTTNATLTAEEDPIGTAAGFKDKNIAQLLQFATKAKGSGDAAALQDSLSIRSDLVKALTAQANDVSATEEVRAQASAILKQLDASLFTPLRSEIKELFQNARRAKQVQEEEAIREEAAARRRAQAEYSRELNAALTQQKQQARRIALNQMEDPKPGAARSFIAKKAAPALADFDTLQQVTEVLKSTDPKVSLTDKNAALQIGREAAVRFNEVIEKLLSDSVMETEKAVLKAIQTKVNSKYSTPLRNNKAIEKKVMANDAWQRMAQQMAAEVSNFQMSRFDFGDSAPVDTVKQTMDAIKKYQTAVDNFNKENFRFANALSTEEQEAALTSLDSARKRVKLAEDELKLRALIGREGEVETPILRSDAGGVRVANIAKIDKATAYGNLTRGLSDAFKTEFDKIQTDFEKLGKTLTEEQFQKGLFGKGADRNDDLVRSFLQAKGASSAVLNDERLMSEELEKHIQYLRDAYRVRGQLNDEIREGVQEARRITDEEKRRQALQKSVAGYKNVVRNAAALVGGVGIGFTAANQIRQSIRAYRDFQQEIAGIQGVLNTRDPREAASLGEGVQEAAVKYGVNLVDAAKSARIFAQAGLNAAETVKQLNLSFAAVKAIGLTIEQVQELQLAVVAVTAGNDKFNQSLNYTALVLEKISAVESKFAVSGQDLSAGLQILSPILEEFAGDVAGTSDVFDVANGLITTAVERLRISGTQAANALKFVFSRITRPEILKKLQEDFKLNIADETGKNLLPIDQLIPVLAARYKELSQKSNKEALNFVNTLSGGRQSPILLAILQEQDRYFKAVSESANAYSGIQERAAIATDTLDTSVKRASAAFDTYIARLIESSEFGQGATVIFKQLADVLTASSKSGTASTLGLLGTVASLSALASGGKWAYTGLSNLAKGTAVASAGTRGLTTALTLMARAFTPAGALLLGITAVASAIGLVTSNLNEAGQSSDDFRVKIKTLEELKANESPAAARLKEVGTFNQDRRNRGAFNLNFADQGDVQRFAESVVASKEVATLQAEAMDAIATGVLKAEVKAGRFASTETAEAKERLKALRAEVNLNSASFDSLFNRFANDDPKALRKLSEKFTEIFGKQLPEESQKAFTAIASQAERVGNVQAIIGSTAVLANLAIADSIEQIRTNTNQLIIDAKKGVMDIQQSTWVTKVLKRTYDLNRPVGASEFQKFTQIGGVFGARPRYVESTARDLIARNPLKDSPLAKGVFNSDLFRIKLEEVIQEIIDNGITITADEALASARDRLTLTPMGRELINSANVLSPASERSRALARSQEGSTGPRRTDGNALLGSLERMANGFAQAATEEVKATAGESPLQEALKLWKEIGERGLGGVDGKKFDDVGKSADRAVRGLNKFTDALLNEVLALAQELQKFEFDQKLAKDFGLGFDSIGAKEQLGRSLLGRADQFGANNIGELLKAAAEKGELERAKAAGQTTARGYDGQVMSIDARIDQIKAGMKQFDTATLANVLPKGIPEAETIIKRITAALNTYGVTAETIKQIEAELGVKLINLSKEERRALNDKLLVNEADLLILQKQQEVATAQLPIFTTLAQRQAIRVDYQQQSYLKQLEQLDLQAKLTGQDAESLRVAKEKLAINAALTQYYEAQMDLVTAQRALQDQIKTNLEGMVSGFTRFLTDTSIWQQLYEDDDAETRWRSRTRVLTNILLDTITPAFKTISDRLANALQDRLVEKLLGLGDLVDIAQMGEARLKQDAQSAQTYFDKFQLASVSGAQTYFDKFQLASASGAQFYYDAIRNASMVGADDLARAVTPDYYGDTSSAVPPLANEQLVKIGEGIATKIPNTPTPDATKKTGLSKQFYAQAIGALGGQVVGAIAGRGGPRAQQGASIGSSAGTLAAPLLAKIIPGLGFLGGPLGIAGAGLLGGLLGGVIGGKGEKPKEREEQPLIQGLEAIERKQVETIQTIQAQTDALLKPESRLLNLPSTFNIPSYTPNLGAGSSGGSVTYIDSRRVEITVNGGDPIAVRKAVEDALQSGMGNVLASQRRNRSWT